jgi:hypothetical protein
MIHLFHVLGFAAFAKKIRLFAIWALLSQSCLGVGTPLDSLVAQAPLVKPQDDGVVYLNVEAAALVSTTGNDPKLINVEGGILKVDHGGLNVWNADQELPYWRIELPKAGRYRIVINHATNLGRESTVQIVFRGSHTRAITAPVESTGGWDVYATENMGEVDLDAGATVVQFKPVSWKHPQWLIKLNDIRLIPLDDFQQLAPVVHSLLDTLGVNADPEVAALLAQHDHAVQQLKADDQTTRNRDFSSYTDYQQFFQFDAATARLTQDQENEKELARRLDDLEQQKLEAVAKGNQLSASDKQNLSGYFAAERALLDGANRGYPKVSFLADTVTANAGPSATAHTLFPTGHFEDLQLQPIDTTLPVVKLDLKPPADLAQRQARFAARDSAGGIANLCREFYATIKPETPGLEEFSSLYKAGHYQEALDAYRAYFFAKLADPEKDGSHTENIVFELTADRGKGHLLFRPNTKVLDYNLHHVAVAEIKGEVIVGDIGAPGSVCWAPVDMALPPGTEYKRSGSTPPEFWKSEPGLNLARENAFFRSIVCLPSDSDSYSKAGFFNALLFSYVVTGNQSHLHLWSDYADDWAMNALQDEENCPWTPKLGTELETQQIRAELTLLRIILDERPEFAHELSSATLARLLLHFQEDYAPYTIRAKRAEIANWGMMGIAHSLDVASFLHEFRASDYFGRESWRLWNINAIQHNTLDGENIEAWDTGHQGVATEYCNESVPIARFPAETTELEKTRFWDTMRVGMRDLLVHISPAGYYWPPATAKLDLVHNDLRNRWLKPGAAGHYTLDKIATEPGARQRIETILNGGKASDAGLPAQSSDFAPYAAMAYLRDSWQPSADYFILQDVRDRSQDLSGCGRGMYELSAGSRTLLTGQPLFVDGKPGNRFYGQIHTGGKTDYCAQAGAHVSPDRFYTSAQFDFAEATQDSPYARPRIPSNDRTGLYRSTEDGLDDPSPITDVIDHRHVFHLRGAGIWIVNDRIENKSGAAHDYAQFVGLPTLLPEDGFADRVRLLAAAAHPLVEEDSAAHRVRTANPGLANVSTYFVGPSPLTFGNHLVNGTKVAAYKTSALETMKTDLATKKPAQVTESDSERWCAVGWNGAGNQSLVTVLYSRAASSGLADSFANDFSKFEEVHEKDNRVGCHLITSQGAEVWFESGPEPINALTCGPCSAQAEALLVVKQDGRITGLLLGGKSMSIAGRGASLHAPDGEFSIDPQGTLTEIAPIQHAIDTVQILPETDAFIDQGRVSFAIPTQDTGNIEFHYTLDGTDPTLESTRYDGPFTIKDTTLVKVLPFRKGLKVTPWNNNGTDSGLTVSALFRKQAPLPAVTAPVQLQPGLGYRYFEGPWPRLFTYAGIDGVLTPQSNGTTSTLLDPKETDALRKTDHAYAVRYDGYVNVPATAVYSFHAPDPLYDTTMDAGYDLRVFVDGHEWYPTPALHARNVWNVALEKGLHALSVAYVDYRWKTFRNDYWMEWQPEEMGKGTPALEISSDGLARQTIPASWFLH